MLSPGMGGHRDPLAPHPVPMLTLTFMSEVSKYLPASTSSTKFLPPSSSSRLKSH